MKNKEKLLIVSAVSPFPKTSGGAVRIYNEIKYLSEQFDIYFVFFLEPGQVLNIEELDFLNQHTKKYIIFNQYPKRSFLLFLNRFQPYWFSNWENQELKIFLPHFIRENKIKKVQIEFTQLLFLYDYIPRNVKKTFVALDISTVSFWRRLLELSDPFTFIVHLIRWLEVYFYEKHFLPKYDLVIAMSEIDKKELTKRFNVKNSIVIPNGIESINFLIKKNNTKVINLGYIGSFKHPPNRNAVVYFIRKIAPKLEKNKIKFKYYLAGDLDQNELDLIINQSNIKNKSNIIILGKIKDVKYFYQNIDVLLAPISSGSGSRIKILESISYGVPVITSRIGIEGVDLMSSSIYIASSPMQYVYFIKQLFYNIQINKNNSSEQILKSKIISLLWKEIFKKYAKL